MQSQGQAQGVGVKRPAKTCKVQGRVSKRPSGTVWGVDSACPSPEMLLDLGHLSSSWNLQTEHRERGPVRAANTARPAVFLQQLWMTLAASSAEADSVLSWNQSLAAKLRLHQRAHDSRNRYVVLILGGLPGIPKAQVGARRPA